MSGRLRATTALAVPLIAATLFWLSPAMPSLAADARLDASVQGPLFSPGDPPLYPGGPALSRDVALSYHGPTATMLVLYVSGFVARMPASAASCTARNPGRLLQLSIEQEGESRYIGSLEDFATRHGDASVALPLVPPRRSGWYDGDRTAVTLEVRLATDADNSFMGCLTGADINWLVG